MFNELKEANIIDIQIKMNKILFYAICSIYIAGKIFLPSDFSRFIAIVLCLFAANWPLLRFVVGVRIDKGWILSVIGIEDGYVTNKSKAEKLMNSSPLIGYLCLFSLFEE